LVYDDATVERMVELFVEVLTLEGGAVLEDRDPGDIGQRLVGSAP
jgi:hypothetical protein